MPKQHLSDQFIKNLNPPEKRTEYYDQHLIDPKTHTLKRKGVKGLLLRLTEAGNKYFYYSYWHHGKSKRFKIGDYPNIGLSEAREKARELAMQVNQGIDPQAEKNKRKNQAQPKTIKDLADEYKKRHFPKLKSSTRSSYRSRIDSEILPVFGKMSIKDVTRRDIISFLEEIVFEEGKNIHANRVRNVFSSMFSFGVQKGLAEFNPVSTVKPVGEENDRDRVYEDEEIKSLWGAFGQQHPVVEGVLKMLLICGQRKGETVQMKWSDIENNVWMIPEEITKNGRTHYVPLSNMAIEVLENLKPITGDSQHVFESHKNKGEPIRWIGSVSERIRSLSKVNDFRMHDLRRTAASNMAKIGIDRTVLGKVLNHKGLAGDSQVTAIYDRYDYMDEKKQALNRWNHKLQAIITGKTEAKITKIS